MPRTQRTDRHAWPLIAVRLEPVVAQRVWAEARDRDLTVSALMRIVVAKGLDQLTPLRAERT